MKKTIAILLTLVLMMGMASVTSFAYGCGRGMCEQPRYEACPVEGCTEIGLHEHDGVTYFCAMRGSGAGYGCGRGWARS